MSINYIVGVCKNINSRELVDRIIRKKPVDRMGYTDKIWGETHEEWKEKGYLSKTDAAGQKVVTSFEEFFGGEVGEIL